MFVWRSSPHCVVLVKCSLQMHSKLHQLLQRNPRASPGLNVSKVSNHPAWNTAGFWFDKHWCLRLDSIRVQQSMLHYKERVAVISSLTSDGAMNRGCMKFACVSCVPRYWSKGPSSRHVWGFEICAIYSSCQKAGCRKKVHLGWIMK